MPVIQNRRAAAREVPERVERNAPIVVVSDRVRPRRDGAERVAQITDVRVRCQFIARPRPDTDLGRYPPGDVEPYGVNALGVRVHDEPVLHVVRKPRLLRVRRDCGRPADSVVRVPRDDLPPAVRPLPQVPVLVVLILVLLPRWIRAARDPPKGVDAELIGLVYRVADLRQEKLVVDENRGIRDRTDHAVLPIDEIVLEGGDVTSRCQHRGRAAMTIVGVRYTAPSRSRAVGVLPDGGIVVR